MLLLHQTRQARGSKGMGSRVKNVTPKSGWERLGLATMAVLAFVIYWTGWAMVVSAGVMVAFGWLLVRAAKGMRKGDNA